MTSNPMALSTTRGEMPSQWSKIVDNQFEEGNLQEGMQVLRMMMAPGYRPSNLHIHVLILISLGRSPKAYIKITKAISDTAISILHDILALVNPASALSPAIPTVEKGSSTSDDIIDYDPANYATLKAAKALVEDCTGGFFDLILETKKARRLRIAKQERLKQAAKSKPTPAGTGEGSPSPWSGSSVSPGFLESERLAGDGEEVVVDCAWDLLSWAISWWEKDEKDGDTSYSPLFITQLPQTGNSEQRWNILRMMVILKCAYSENKNLTLAEAKEHRKTGSRLIGLMINASIATPTSMISPSSIIGSLTNLLLDLPPTQLSLFINAIPTSPPQLQQELLCNVIHRLAGKGDLEVRRSTTSSSRVAKRKTRGGPNRLSDVAGSGSESVVSSEATTVGGRGGKMKLPYVDVERTKMEEIRLLEVARTAANAEDDKEKMMLLQDRLAGLLNDSA